MHEEVLPKGTSDVFVRLAQSGLLRDAYLAGGTNIALQLGHRISRDLDFFFPDTFDERSLAQQLEKLGLSIERMEWQTVDGFFDEVKFSCFSYPYPVLFPSLPYGEMHLADLHDAAIMKIDTIASRGARRDFIDLYSILQNRQWSLHDMMVLYERKYAGTRNTLLHALKSLTYFADAEADETPLVLLHPVAWPDIEMFFRTEVANAAGKLLT